HILPRSSAPKWALEHFGDSDTPKMGGTNQRRARATPTPSHGLGWGLSGRNGEIFGASVSVPHRRDHPSS
ncbi:MAG: hypothetical protein V3R80_13355, partial [Candidatus Tectomicrobia bacterium]